jgi:Zn-dependent protease with chaperone function
MQIKTDSLFFDGQTSASKQIFVEIIESKGELNLLSDNETNIVWLLHNLEFDLFDDFLEIRNIQYAGQLLQIKNKEFIDVFYSVVNKNKQVDVHTRILKLGFSKIIAIAFALFFLILLGYFFVLPPIAEKSAELIPETFDDKIGDLFVETYLDKKDIDSAKTRHLEEFAAEIRLLNKKPLRFFVVNSTEVNAFALPNGQIVVYSGIIDGMRSPDELVALLGHEAAHVNQRHSTKMLCRNLAGYMIVSLLFSDVNGVMAVLADNAQQLHALSFSRKFENEADEIGLSVLFENKINPFGMVRLFEQLEKENYAAVPTILRSHPLTKERKEHMKNIISNKSYQVNSNKTLDVLFEKIKNKSR